MASESNSQSSSFNKSSSYSGAYLDLYRSAAGTGNPNAVSDYQRNARDILDQYGGVRDRVLGSLVGSNKAELQDIYQQYVKGEAANKADLISRGLRSTTRVSTDASSLLAAKWRAEIQSNSALARLIADYDARISLSQLSAAGGFLNTGSQLEYSYAALAQANNQFNAGQYNALLHYSQGQSSGGSQSTMHSKSTDPPQRESSGGGGGGGRNGPVHVTINPPPPGQAPDTDGGPGDPGGGGGGPGDPSGPTGDPFPGGFPTEAGGPFPPTIPGGDPATIPGNPGSDNGGGDNGGLPTYALSQPAFQGGLADYISGTGQYPVTETQVA